MHITIKTKPAFLVLMLSTIAICFAAIKVSDVTHELLPAEQSIYPWHVVPSSDSNQNGNSIIELREAIYSLNFDFQLLEGAEYPYVTVGITFDTQQDPERLMDWSLYSSVRMRVKCRPGNELSFVLHTFEGEVTQYADATSFRPSLSFFKCHEQWQDIAVSLERLVTPEWWLKQKNLGVSTQAYDLTKVRGFSIATSTDSPLHVESSAHVDVITLQGRNWVVIYAGLSVVILLWGGFFYWALRYRVFNSSILPAPTPVQQAHYERVTSDSKHEREKAAVLGYLASQYTNPDLNVETVVNALGINRVKINDILRNESGTTFIGYINKVRLTEAARLLAEKRMGVAEAAFAVGFGSVSYFNRAFKKEFGVAPSAYKNALTDAPDSTPSP